MQFQPTLLFNFIPLHVPLSTGFKRTEGKVGERYAGLNHKMVKPLTVLLLSCSSSTSCKALHSVLRNMQSGEEFKRQQLYPGLNRRIIKPRNHPVVSFLSCPSTCKALHSILRNMQSGEEFKHQELYPGLNCRIIKPRNHPVVSFLSCPSTSCKALHSALQNMQSGEEFMRWSYSY